MAIVRQSMPRLSASALGVGMRAVARVAARHRDAVHVLGPERVGRDRGDERGVDPAGEADDDIAEPVLGHIVAGAEDEGFVDLLVAVGHRGDDGRGDAVGLGVIG